MVKRQNNINKLKNVEMKKICVLILYVLAVNQLTAQQKFEFGMNVNSGFYFAEEPVLSYKIENGLQFNKK